MKTKRENKNDTANDTNNVLANSALSDWNEKFKRVEKDFKVAFANLVNSNEYKKMLNDVKIIWHNPENRKPLCYQIGDWDGKRSDNVLVELKNGNYVVAVCYEGVIDGCRFFDWYYGVDEWELKESEVRRWMNIPD